LFVALKTNTMSSFEKKHRPQPSQQHNDASAFEPLKIILGWCFGQK